MVAQRGGTVNSMLVQEHRQTGVTHLKVICQ
jgi:hypothetical protein